MWLFSLLCRKFTSLSTIHMTSCAPMKQSKITQNTRLFSYTLFWHESHAPIFYSAQRWLHTTMGYSLKIVEWYIILKKSFKISLAIINAVKSILFYKNLFLFIFCCIILILRADILYIFIYFFGLYYYFNKKYVSCKYCIIHFKSHFYPYIFISFPYFI